MMIFAEFDLLWRCYGVYIHFKASVETIGVSGHDYGAGSSPFLQEPRLITDPCAELHFLSAVMDLLHGTW